MGTLELVVNSAEAPGKYLIALDGNRLVYASMSEVEREILHRDIAKKYNFSTIIGGGRVIARDGAIQLPDHSFEYGHVPVEIMAPFASPLAKAYRARTGTPTPTVYFVVEDFGIHRRLPIDTTTTVSEEFVRLWLESKRSVGGRP